jgi:hypothetical protein
VILKEYKVLKDIMLYRVGEVDCRGVKDSRLGMDSWNMDS